MLAFDPILAVHGGEYISIGKIVPVFILLLIWVKLLGWTDQDAQRAHLPRIPLNVGNTLGLAAAFALFFLLPTFILSFFALLLIVGAEAGVYLVLRRKEVGLADLGTQFNDWVKSLTARKKPGDEALSVGKAVIIGKDSKPLPVPDGRSPDRPAYDAVQNALDAMGKDAQQIDVAPEGEGMAVTYTVDNVTHRGATLDRALGTAAIAYAKWAGGLNIEDKRKPQTSLMKVLYNKNKFELRVQTAGTTAGEFLRIVVNPKTRHTYALNDLGFTTVQRELMTSLIKKNKGGIILLSAPKGHGLTSMLYSLLRSHDAFLEHAQTLERDQEQDLEGITQNKLDPTANMEEEANKVDWIISTEADVFGASKIENPRSAAMMIDYAKANKRAYICFRANSTFEALDQWKRLVGDGATATSSLKAVINGRVLRKLCPACKEGYTPDPVTLKKLNMDADKTITLFKARETPLKDAYDKPIECEFCHGLQYKGRIGVFETLVVDEDVRQAVETNKPLNQAFRKQHGRYLQEEALALVEKGETSVQEVLRILKPVENAAPTAAAVRQPKVAAVKS